jgi:hypothetical protein
MLPGRLSEVSSLSRTTYGGNVAYVYQPLAFPIRLEIDSLAVCCMANRTPLIARQRAWRCTNSIRNMCDRHSVDKRLALFPETLVWSMYLWASTLDHTIVRRAARLCRCVVGNSQISGSSSLHPVIINDSQDSQDFTHRPAPSHRSCLLFLH